MSPFEKFTTPTLDAVIVELERMYPRKPVELTKLADEAYRLQLVADQSKWELIDTIRRVRDGKKKAGEADGE